MLVENTHVHVCISIKNIMHAHSKQNDIEGGACTGTLYIPFYSDTSSLIKRGVLYTCIAGVAFEPYSWDYA